MNKITRKILFIFNIFYILSKFIHLYLAYEIFEIILINVILEFVILNIVLFILVSSFSRHITGIRDIVKSMALGKSNLTQRLPMKKFNCSELKKCNNKICPEYNKSVSCWDTVGSNAPDKIHCPSILNGKINSCYDCNVMQMAITDEFEDLKARFLLL